MKLEEFIQKQTQKIIPLELANRKAWWDLAVTGNADDAEAFKNTTIALRKVFNDPKECAFLRSHQEDSSPLIARQAFLLLNEYLENQIPQEQIEEISQLETDVESLYTNFRAKVGSSSYSNNDIKNILLKSNDSLLRMQVWEASKAIGQEVSEKVLTLISLRNQNAQKNGFKNYYQMRLELQEIDEKKLFDWMDLVEKLTTPLFATYKNELDNTLRKRFSCTSLMPWHYSDPFFQEAPTQKIDFDHLYLGKDIVKISQQFYSSIGLPVDDILARSDLYERDKKNQHAFCMCLDRGQDVRILCNICDNEYWMSVQLHELGHAVYDKYINTELPFLLRTYAHTSTTEAIAMLFGRLALDKEFLTLYCGVDEKEASAIALSSKMQQTANLLVFARWSLVMVHFEKALYEGKKDLNTYFWDLVEKFQYLSRPSLRNKPDWASKLHLACAPAYYQNYLLGEMMASQILFHIKKDIQTTLWNNQEVGNWLKTKLFALGATLPWEKTLQTCTGKPLSPEYFVQDLTA